MIMRDHELAIYYTCS